MKFKKINDGILTWSWLSQEKGYFFNGTLVRGAEKRVLIDPVFMDNAGCVELQAHGPFDMIYLTNKDHERMCWTLRKHFKIPVAIHESDAPLLKEKPDSVFRDGQELLCGLQVIHLKNQKSPGECAFYLKDQKILIAGDALIGYPAGQLNMLPDEKYADVPRAQAGLRRLFSLSFDMFLAGDGEPVLENAHDVLENCFDRLR